MCIMVQLNIHHSRKRRTTGPQNSSSRWPTGVGSWPISSLVDPFLAILALAPPSWLLRLLLPPEGGMRKQRLVASLSKQRAALNQDMKLKRQTFSQISTYSATCKEWGSDSVCYSRTISAMIFFSWRPCSQYADSIQPWIIIVPNCCNKLIGIHVGGPRMVSQ